MKLVGAMRVKNEARWIAESIASQRGICSAVHVMDDHSTDDTAEIARNCGAIVHPSPFGTFDEARDKSWLMERVVEGSDPDWCLMIDGDEVLAPRGAWKVLAIVESAQALAYSLPVIYLWNNRQTRRVDGVYRTIEECGRPSLFRVYTGRRLAFQEGNAAGNLHCSNVPAVLRGNCPTLPAPLLHLGYMHREDRVRKFEWYNARDPRNAHEDEYRHVVIGDIFPASSRFKHAGPLQLEPVSA